VISDFQVAVLYINGRCLFLAIPFQKMSACTTLSTYMHRFETILKMIKVGDIDTIQSTFDDYSKIPLEDYSIPKSVYDNIIMHFFLGEIYIRVGMLDACNQIILEALDYLHVVSKQLIMVKRLISSDLNCVDCLGSLDKLAEGPRYLIAQYVYESL
jgi:hypothetical protein